MHTSSLLLQAINKAEAGRKYFNDKMQTLEAFKVSLLAATFMISLAPSQL